MSGQPVRKTTVDPRGAVAVGVLGLAVGLCWAGRPSPWYDEAATMSAVRRHWCELWRLVLHVDFVHALYYVSAKSWAWLFGDSLVALRALSAVGLGVAAALMVLLVSRLATRRLALGAGVAVVLTPGVSWAGLEARGYSWSAALATLATYLLVVARERGGAASWAAYALAVVGCIWLFLFSAVMLAVHGVALLVTDRRLPVPWLVSAATTSALVVPLVMVASGDAGQVRHIDLSRGEVLVRVLGAQPFVGPGFRSEHRDAWLLAGAATGALALVAVLTGVVRRRSLTGLDPFLVPLAWAWALIPTLVIAGAHLAGAQVYQVRYVTYSVPGAALLVVVGIASAPSRPRLVLAAALLAVVIPVLVGQHDRDAKSGENYRALALFAEQSGADRVLFSGGGSRGIRIAYPASFRGTQDLLLRLSPNDSDNLFGTNRRHRSLRPTEVATHLVVVYRMTTNPNDPVVRRLEAWGCLLLRDEPTRRFTGVLYRC